MNPIYDINRPVHLGRRDFFLEKVNKLLQQCLADKFDGNMLHHIDLTLYFLQAAFEHSMLAANSAHADPLEKSLITLLKHILLHLHSARTIVANEHQSKNKNPHNHFLNHHSSIEQENNVTKSSKDILGDVFKTFGMAEEPFRSLQQKIIGSMNENDRNRYKRAYESLKKFKFTSSFKHHAVTYAQTSCSALEMKYG